MAKITENEVRKLVDKVKDLANGTIANQLEACEEYLCKKLFPCGDCVDRSIIPELLPFIVKCMASTKSKLQQEGAFFVTAIVWNDTKSENENRRIYKEDTKLVINAGALPKLIKLVSSKNTTTLVLDQSLGCLVKIAAHFPKEVVKVGALSHLKRLLKSRNKEVSCKAAKGLFYISNECEENIIDFITGPLLQLLKSKNNEIHVCEDALHTLVDIVSYDSGTCQFLLDHNILKCLNKFFGQDEPPLLLIVRFIRKVASLGEDQVDMIIREKFIPVVIQQLDDGNETNIKIEAVKAIINIVQSKHAFVPNLVDQYDIITLLSNKLNSSSVRFLGSVLTALNEIINIFEDRKQSRQMVKNSANYIVNLENLLNHENETIRDLSKTLNEFIVDDGHGTIELDSSEDGDPRANESVTTPTSQKRRRPPRSRVGELTPASKRSKRSLRQNEPSDSISFDDLDDVRLRPDSPVGITLPSIPTRLQSDVNETINNETDRDNISVSPASHYQNADSDHPLTAPSFVEPGLPEGTKTLDTTTPTNRTLSLSHSANPSTELNPSIHSGSPSTKVDLNIQSTKSSTPSNQSIQSSGLSTQSDQKHADLTNESNPTVQSADPSTESTSCGATATPKNEPGNDVTPSPARPSPVIEIPLPVELTQPRNEFEAVKYYRPPEPYIDSCCRSFEEIDSKKVHFDSDIYIEFVSNIKIKSIGPNSKPDTCFQTIDTSGFSCLSLLFTGTEKYTETIREKIYKKFTLYEMENDTFNGARNGRIVGLPHVLKKEHLDTVALWFKCRIMVYSNGEGWQQYGQKESEDRNYVPIFVLEKKKIKEKYIYQVVLTVKD